MGQQLLIYNIVAPAQGFKYSKLARLRNWKSIMSCLCCSNDDMQWPSDIAQFMGNNASDDSYLGWIFFFRPYEVITTGTHKQIPIWHLGLNPNLDGKLSTEKERMCFLNLSLQVLYFHDQVWKMEWNISGMTLATTGGDGVPTFLLPTWHKYPFNLKAYMDDYGGINDCG
ncbi:hypothetical protein RHMOL_Rhmol01G0086800 [Rhododendron molle]|uniref:Uncharacterized protein n=1 Tax=Rhododendron molle TaxID=49168 RepID=A0ACC0Q0W0_RHOML|nr:hypothetical protein RHMOL_Rhmol01G0086800 [Rhododendron molle]